ncbi:MAG: polysaccharide deacetylase family protein [Bacteroidia bacterium]|nr:polysaccharide deacetylase family protein [Bacteroidia bacterium]
MKPYLAKTPQVISTLFRNQVWSYSRLKKNIYLTFDDGPTPKITEWVLDTLKQYNAQATFFCIGKNIEQNPAVFKKIIDHGHAIGNHTYDHLNGWKSKKKDYINSVLKTEKIISEYIEHPSQKLFRPPYGRIRITQTNELSKYNYKVIMWSVLSGDFDHEITNDDCLKNVINNSNYGDIIVFHDSEKAFDKLKVVLPKTLEILNEKGYNFKKIEN